MKAKFVCLIFILCGCLPLVAQHKPMEKVDKDGIYLVAEKMPEFPGGMQELINFLKTNVKYPVEAQRNKITGRVIVQFVVMEDGSLSMEQIARGVDPLLDAEALRVVKLMPKWTPATEKGVPVKVRFTVPIVFNLTNEAGRPLRGFTIPVGQEIKNKTLEGVWQSCRVEPGEKEYRVTVAPVLKVLAADKTFMNLFTGDGKVSAAIIVQGNYEKTSDHTYVETLLKSVAYPFEAGAKTEITFEFLNDNLTKFTFMVPGKEIPWIEYWFRVPMPERSIPIQQKN